MPQVAMNQISTTEKARANAVKKNEPMANSTGKTSTSKKSERKNRTTETPKLSNVDVAE